MFVTRFNITCDTVIIPTMLCPPAKELILKAIFKIFYVITVCGEKEALKSKLVWCHFIVLQGEKTPVQFSKAS